MTADIEQDLRQLFEADAAHAPVPHDLAAGARRIAHQQVKRQRRAAVLACAGVAVLLVGGFALLRPTGDTAAPASTAQPHPTPTTSTTKAPVTDASDEPALRYHNVEVPVPASMLDPSHVRCGYAVADAAYVIPRPPSCFIYRADNPKLTTVVLQPWTDQIDHNVGGKPSPGVLPDGRTRLVTRIPASDLQLIVTSPDPKRAQRLFNGLLIIDMAHGCPVKRAGQSVGPVPATGEPGGGSVCAYQNGWLVGSAWLDNRQAEEMLQLLNAPKSSGPPVSCAPPPGIPPVERWAVHLRLPDGEQVVEVPFDYCDQSPLTERLQVLAPPPTDATRS